MCLASRIVAMMTIEIGREKRGWGNACPFRAIPAELGPTSPLGSIALG
jgi:hypothetical protein